jgi:hypothetical protein
MKKICLILLLLPLYLTATENEVPLGTKGNKLLFAVKNPNPVPIQNIHVVIISCPDWIVFEQKIFRINAISANGENNAEFVFQVTNGETERIGTVQLIVEDEKGNTLANRNIQMKTVIATNEIKLFPPYPNPANPSVTLQYALPDAGHVRIEILNVLGQNIRELVNEKKPAGQWEIVWDGRNNEAMTVSSGIYVVWMQTILNGRRNNLVSKVMIKR